MKPQRQKPHVSQRVQPQAAGFVSGDDPETPAVYLQASRRPCTSAAMNRSIRAFVAQAKGFVNSPARR